MVLLERQSSSTASATGATDAAGTAGAAGAVGAAVAARALLFANQKLRSARSFRSRPASSMPFQRTIGFNCGLSRRAALEGLS